MITYLSEITSIDENYIILVIKSIIILLVLDIFKSIIVLILKNIRDNKKRYYIIKKIKTFINIFKILMIIFLWSSYLSKVVTIISFVSAACTIALKDLVVDLFSGMYIRIRKPFELEDRIEINNTKGDVVNINNISFDILEVKNDSFIGQSTGVIVHVPNSYIFKYPLRNYNRGFKYIWNEMVININPNSDIEKTKEKILEIVNKNEILKEVPNKLQNRINDISDKYRIYYNNCEPVIYTIVTNECVELTLRYLVSPKKARYVSSTIWKYILKANSDKEITLFFK